MSPFSQKAKLGSSYWDDYPLRSVEDVRRWSDDRILGTGSGGTRVDQQADVTPASSKQTSSLPNAEDPESRRHQTAPPQPENEGYGSGSSVEQPEEHFVGQESQDDRGDGMDPTDRGQDDEEVSPDGPKFHQRALHPERGTAAGSLESAYIW